MRRGHWAFKTLRVFGWSILGIVLLVLGLLLTLYSSWGQNKMRSGLLSWLNSRPGVEAKMESFRLKFPLDLTIEGLQLIQNGDTTLAASRLEADVALSPLFIGKVEASKLALGKARFQIGNADSLTMVMITADSLRIAPAKVELAKLHIDLQKGYIIGGRVNLISRPDTISRPSTPTDTTTTLQITAADLTLKDFTYYMRMVPTMDSLSANIQQAQVKDIRVDLQTQQVAVKSFLGDGLNAAYIACDSSQIANTYVPPTLPGAATKPWTVTLDSIHFSNATGLYTTKGYIPQPGLDFGYIQASDMELSVHNFYNQETTLKLPIWLRGTERCGLTLEANGTFAMDSLAMYFRDFVANTETTRLTANGMLGVGDMLTDPNLPMQLTANGNVSIPDLKIMFPTFQPYLAALPDNTDVKLALDLNGTSGNLDVEELGLDLNGIVNLRGNGELTHVFSEQGMDCDVKLSGHIFDVNSILHSLNTGVALAIPPMELNGDFAMNHGNIDANLTAETKLGGNLSLDAKYVSNVEGYDLNLKTFDFPVDAFVKDMGLGKLTAELHAKGEGFDLFSNKTTMDVRADLHSIQYNKETYQDIQLLATIDEGQADVHLNSDNPDLDLSVTVSGNLSGTTYDWDLAVNGRNINLYALKLAPEETQLAIFLIGNAKIDASAGAISASADLQDLIYAHPTGEIALSDVKAKFDACDSIITLSVINRDLNAQASIDCGIDTLIMRASMLSAVIDEQMAQWKILPDTIQKVLPKLDIYVTAGADNMINDILSASKMSMESLRLRAQNDSVLSLKAQMLGFDTGSLTMDTIGMKLSQRANKMQLILKADNQPGTLDQFAHIRLDGLINTNKVALRGTQKNIQGETGFDIGALVSLVDSTQTVSMRLFPLNPVIGYKDWSVNFDNFISYEVPHKHIDANLKMKSPNAGSELNLYTLQSTDSLTDNIVLQVKNVQISDWIVINPWAPPIEGNLSADMQLQWDGGQDINGQGNITLADFKYARQRVGTFATDVDIVTNTSGMVKANLNLDVDGQQALTLHGVLNDSIVTSPFDLDLALIKFPLKIANPFLPEKMVALSGTLNGEMCVSGDMDNPLLNGNINFDNAGVKAYMTNTQYKISDTEIPVVNNLITFNDFSIFGANENPLSINGTVDMSSFIDPKINLGLKAQNMMLVNTNKAAKGAEIYGKAYMDFGATVKGNMRFMSISANMTVLSGTNITYVMSDATTAIETSKNDNMVHFVNFQNPEEVIQADTISESSMMLLLDANLTIQNATTINVDLNTTSRDKVQVMPEGALTLSMTPLSDPRLTGRININEGLVRYTIPVIGQEKNFTFDPGSFIAFTGDMLNPTLNIHATDEVKTNVTESGNSHLVNFDILLGVTGTLETMNVKFDLTTNDDITVANELQTMSADQRASQAMNLLLYGVYTGPGTSATANIGANPLFSFLESQVNNWAAQNIKGVDLSFGINQYNQTTNGNTSSTTSYSYQVSKSLFNDRVKIVVGGNYTTDNNADENLSQNLVNDIAFEYYLNQQHTMLLKLFRHTGYESILEGEITRTGVGFVYRRKVNRLVQILPRFLRPAKYKKIL